jgi:hypothetical protein
VVVAALLMKTVYPEDPVVVVEKKIHLAEHNNQGVPAIHLHIHHLRVILVVMVFVKVDQIILPVVEVVQVVQDNLLKLDLLAVLGVVVLLLILKEQLILTLAVAAADQLLEVFKEETEAPAAVEEEVEIRSVQLEREDARLVNQEILVLMRMEEMLDTVLEVVEAEVRTAIQRVVTVVPVS